MLFRSTASSHGCVDGDFVFFSGASTFNGVTISGEYQITLINSSTYTIESATQASGTGSGGGSSVIALYEINVGPEIQIPRVGWGSGAWSSGSWGFSAADNLELRLWSQANFGEDLVYNPRYDGLYYWDATDGVKIGRAHV